MLAAQTIPDAVKMCKGKMSAGEFAENTTSNAAGIGAGYAGGTFGAALGTFVCPGVGTVIGGLVGGVAGGFAGSSVVRGGVCQNDASSFFTNKAPTFTSQGFVMSKRFCTFRH